METNLKQLPGLSNIPYGYCRCGCGQKTNLVKWSDKTKRLIKGEPYRFVFGHGKRCTPRKTVKSADGRLMVYKPGHPRSMTNGYVFNHLLVAEVALGKPIPKEIDVHHPKFMF